ncbi:hypothetical protein BT69DRAFT_1319150 [Atractiella rhizophila]|nr:hypothetical protein BT69DRAFT_1319150 [Atractiella rhizophila]
MVLRSTTPNRKTRSSVPKPATPNDVTKSFDLTMDSSIRKMSLPLGDTSGRSSFGGMGGGRLSSAGIGYGGVGGEVEDTGMPLRSYTLPERLKGDHEDEDGLLAQMHEDLDALEALEGQISKTVLDRRREHEAALAELEALRIDLESEMKDSKLKGDGMKDVFAQEAKTIATEKAKLKDLKSSYDASVAHNDTLQRDLKAWTEKKEKLVRANLQRDDEISRHSIRNKNEFAFLEQYAGLEIRTIERDCIRFEFTQIDPSNHDRRFIIELDLGSEYQIRSHSPTLATMKANLDQLNDDRDFYGFLVKCRKQWKESASRKV